MTLSFGDSMNYLTFGTSSKMFGVLATAGVVVLSLATVASGETLDAVGGKLAGASVDLELAEMMLMPDGLPVMAQAMDKPVAQGFGQLPHGDAVPQMINVRADGSEMDSLPTDTGSGGMMQTNHLNAAPSASTLPSVVGVGGATASLELTRREDNSLAAVESSQSLVEAVRDLNSNQLVVVAPAPDVVEPKKWGIGVRAQASTLGLFGVDAGYRFSDNFHARLGLDVGGFGYNTSNSGVDYDANLSLSNVHLLGDYFPFGGGMRLTGGLIFQGNRLTGNAKPTAGSTVNLGGQSYTLGANQQIASIGSEAAFGSAIAPYIGIGFGTPISPGLSFNADLGVMFPGSPAVKLNPVLSSATLGNAALTNEINTQVQRQQDATNRDIAGFSVYPVLSIGFSYAF
jgi:hypothetical protein